MTYVVAGPSGHTGRVVAEALLAEGAKVRVLARDPSKVAAFVKQGAEVAVADLGDAASVERALEGAKGAYVLVPPDLRSNHVIADQARVTESLATAIDKSHVPHVVFLSSVGAHLPSGTGPIVSLHRAEERFSKIPTTHFTFLRASYFMENLGGSLGTIASGVFPTFLTADRAVEMVATRDIGLTAARLLHEGESAPHVVELAGPEKVSPREIGVILGKLIGKDVTVKEAPTSAMSATLVGFGFTPDLAGLYCEMTEAFNEGKLVFEGGEARTVRGKTDVSEVLAQMLKG